MTSDIFSGFQGISMMLSQVIYIFVTVNFDIYCSKFGGWGRGLGEGRGVGGGGLNPPPPQLSMPLAVRAQSPADACMDCVIYMLFLSCRHLIW
jgi:hypothetical protein